MQPIMKLDRFETHDRYDYLKKQDFDIAECCQDLINKRPFGNHAFYIFAHTRTDETAGRTRMIWQPRLTKPNAQANSMLFKAYPGSDIIKTIWIIPKKELWEQYEKGKMLENEMIVGSIQDYMFRRSELESPEDDDLNDDQINQIYRQIGQEIQRKKMMKELNKANLMLPWPKF